MTTSSDSTTAYEPSDADVRLIAVLATGLFGFVVIAPLALLALYPQSADRREPRPPQIDAGPILQRDPQADLTAFRREEETRLSVYGWADPSKSHVHIPIDRALSLINERGLPGWTR